MWHVETDYFALVIFLVMLIKTKNVRKENGLQDKAFSVVLVLSIISVSVDIISSAAMNDCTNWWVYQIVMTIYVITMPLLAAVWVCYTIVLIFKDEPPLAKRYISLSLIPFAFFALLAATNPWTELFFRLTPTIEYSRGPLFISVGVGFIMLYSLIGMLVVLLNHKRIDPKSNILLLTLFFGVSAISIWVQMAHPGWLIINACYAVVYVFCDFTIEDQRRHILYDTIQSQNQSLEKAVKKAEEASSAKSSFLSRMSHEIRTPINVIMGINELIAQDAEKNLLNQKQLLSYTAETTDATQYLLALVNDILDTAKIERNTLTLKPTVIGATGYLKNISTLIQPLAEQKGITFTCERKSALNEYYYADGVRVQQIIMNLLNNAVKFTPSGGHITLTAEQTAHDKNQVTVLFTVSDDGIGMSREFQEKMFEPFTQEYNDKTSPYTGTGIGLMISKKLAQMMGGDIVCHSEKGKGTTFTIWVNAEIHTPNSAKAVLEEQNTHWDFSGIRVLLCEDHPLNQKIASKLLTNKGCEVEIASNGVEGVDLFQNHDAFYYDLILMDIRMPILDGLEATKMIRNINKKDAAIIPIIAMSANAYEEDVQKSLGAGMNDHLAKPVDPQKLYRTIFKVLTH